MDNKKIGDYIATLRKNRNLTQKDLAELLGVTDKAVSKWERGAGYPDISMLRPLADILGTTVNELLEGEGLKDITEEDTKNFSNTVKYTSIIMSLKNKKLGRLSAAILAVSLFIAIFTTVIVNISVNHYLSWSLLVIDGCVMGGCLFIPPLLWKKHGFFLSLCLLTVLIMPFLWIIELLTGSTGQYGSWTWKLGFPISVNWLLILWIIVFLSVKTRLNGWFISSISLLLLSVGNIITNYTINKYLLYTTYNMPEDIGNIIVIISLIFLAIICFVIGLVRKYSTLDK